MRNLVLILALALLVPAAAAAAADSLTITVGGVRSDKGSVRAAVYEEAGFLDPTKMRGQAMAKAAAAEVRVAVANLPPGRYAVVAFHDENDNGKLDRNAMNVPIEGYGFSNDARGNFGPPKFSAAAFVFDAQHAAIKLELDY